MHRLGFAVFSLCGALGTLALDAPARAADLGGDCCADLEERVAELEATAARKGNRKVSLTISGMVAEEITWWDDGRESNAYVSGIGATLGTNIQFNGAAKIAPGWTAGYLLYLEPNYSDPEFTSQNAPDGIAHSKNLSTGVTVHESYWYLNSDKFGKVSVGRLSQASDKAAALVDGSGSLLQANWVLFDGLSFNMLHHGEPIGAPWGALGFCHQISAPIGANCNGLPTNAVRYDTPVFAGFSVSASWGEDDFWDMAVRYVGVWGDFKFASTAAYSESTDSNMGLSDLFPAPVDKDSSYFQVGAYLEHVPTGLFAYGAYGTENNHDNITPGAGARIPSNDQYYVKVGAKENLLPLGQTVFYGEYARNNNQLAPALLDAGFTKSELNHWGVGVVQYLDAAAMSVWVKYRHFDGSLGDTTSNITADGFDMVVFGSAINF